MLSKNDQIIKYTAKVEINVMTKTPYLQLLRAGNEKEFH